MSGILLVEDDQQLRTHIKEILLAELTDISVWEASNFKECLKKLYEKSVDMILMDIRLQNESGLMITRVVKRLYPKIYLAIHSFYDSSEYYNASMEAGADCFLSKKTTSVSEIVEVAKKHINQVK